MNSKIYYYIGIGFLILLVVGGGAFFYYAAFGDLFGGETHRIANKYTPPTGLRVTQDGTLFFVWEDLPNGTTAVNIYRARKDTQEWKLWKTVQITGDLSEGSIQIQSSVGDLGDFVFYYEAVNSSGDTLWESEEDEIAPLPPPGGDSGGDDEGDTTPPPGDDDPPLGDGGDDTPPGNSTSTDDDNSTSTLPGDDDDTSTSTNPDPGESYPSGTIPYYTPSGDLSGTKLYNSSFWVEVVNNRLEFNWQNIFPLTTIIHLERSQSPNGPWEIILEQNNPELIGPYTISLLDAAVSAPFYYRLHTYLGSSSLGTYGPVFIEQ